MKHTIRLSDYPTIRLSDYPTIRKIILPLSAQLSKTLLILAFSITSLCGQQCILGDPSVFVGCDPVIQNMDAPGPFFVRIFVHVIRKDDGTGGITDEQVQEGIDFLHDAYDEHEIFFIWDCNIDNIPSSTWYYANSPLSGFFQSTPFNNHFNTSGINIYIFPDRPYPYATFEGLAKSSPGKACLVMGNYPLAPYQAFSRSHILSHEVGHCLGLLHTPPPYG
jgi:hypothetical protein